MRLLQIQIHGAVMMSPTPFVVAAEKLRALDVEMLYEGKWVVVNGAVRIKGDDGNILSTQLHFDGGVYQYPVCFEVGYLICVRRVE